MNGRLYDSMLHRFLMPDNFVQDPYNSLSYNRYAYAMYNPLIYFDPSGEISWKSIGGWIQRNSKEITFVATIAVAIVATVATAGMASPLLAGVIVGGSAGFTAGALGTWTSGGSFGDGLVNGLVQGSIGAVAGGVGAGVGNWAANNIGGAVINGIKTNSPLLKGIIGGAFGGGAGGFAGGSTTSLLSGGNLNDALNAGLNGAASGALLGSLVGGAQGYKYAKANGLDPLSGKLLDQKGFTVVRHHTSSEAMQSIKDSQEIYGWSRESGYGFKGTDFEATPNFNGNQNFGNAGKGAFIEMRLSNQMLVPYNSPNLGYSNYFRVNTGGANFQIYPSYKPQYYKIW